VTHHQLLTGSNESLPCPVAGILLLLDAQPADGAADPWAPSYAGRRLRGP